MANTETWTTRTSIIAAPSGSTGNERPDPFFGVDEVLPKKVATWVNRKHPDSGKKQILLNFMDWQKGQAARIISDFELHTYVWTLTAVKFRESLEQQDRRDLAQFIFARDHVHAADSERNVSKG